MKKPAIILSTRAARSIYMLEAVKIFYRIAFHEYLTIIQSVALILTFSLGMCGVFRFQWYFKRMQVMKGDIYLKQENELFRCYIVRESRLDFRSQVYFTISIIGSFS